MKFHVVSLHGIRVVLPAIDHFHHPKCFLFLQHLGKCLEGGGAGHREPRLDRNQPGVEVSALEHLLKRLFELEQSGRQIGLEGLVAEYKIEEPVVEYNGSLSGSDNIPNPTEANVFVQEFAAGQFGQHPAGPTTRHFLNQPELRVLLVSSGEHRFQPPLTAMHKWNLEVGPCIIEEERLDVGQHSRFLSDILVLLGDCRIN